MTPEILYFAQQMDAELKSNEHKGDWKSFQDVNKIIAELEWHKAKFYMATKDLDRPAMMEYLADCANNLMFLANAFALIPSDLPPEEDLTGSY